MRLEVGPSTLTARANRDGEEFGGTGRRELVQAWAGVVQPGNKETDTLWAPTVCQRVDMGIVRGGFG